MAATPSESQDEPEAELDSVDSSDKPLSERISPRVMEYIRQGKPSEDAPLDSLKGAVADYDAKADEVVAEVTDESAAVDEDASTDAGDPVVSDEPAPWYGAQEIEFARSYGISADRLANMSGRDELNRHIMYGAELAQHFRQQPAAPQVLSQPAAQSAAEGEPAGPVNADGTMNVQWLKDNGYDDEYHIAQAESHNRLHAENQQFRRESERLKAEHAAQREQQLHEAYHDAIDKLGRPELFGNSIGDKPLTQAEINNRNLILQRIEPVRLGQEQANLSFDLNLAVATVAPQQFSTAFAAIDAKKQQAAERAKLEKIAKQSTRRRPVAAQAGATSHVPIESDPNSPEAILRKPAFLKWRRDKAEQYGEALT